MKRGAQEQRVTLAVSSIITIMAIFGVVLILSGRTVETVGQAGFMNTNTGEITAGYAKDLYSQDPVIVQTDPTLSPAECEHIGFKNCEETYARGQYPQRTTITEKFKRCTDKVREICNQAQKNII